MKRTIALLMAFFLLLLWGCTESGNPALSTDPAPPTLDLNFDGITQVRVSQIRETAVSWIIDDPDRVEEIVTVFRNMTFGEAHSGGGVGSFMNVQFLAGDEVVAVVDLFQPQTIQFCAEDSIYVVEILDKAWMEEDWENLLRP